MSRFIIKPATPEYDFQLSEMSKVPMPGMISLALEKTPSYFDAIKLSSEKTGVFICIDTHNNSMAATFNIGQRRRSAKGEWVWQKYFSDLRIVPSYRGSRLLYYLINFINENHFLTENDVAENIIFADNKQMIGYALNSSERRKSIPNVPVYHYAHDYLTYTIAAQNLKTRMNGIQVRPASAEDLQILKAFHYQNALKQDGSHYIDWDALGSGHYKNLNAEDFQIAFDGEEVAGIMGAWNQTAIKRTRVADYAPALKLLRPILNGFAPVTGSIRLPQAGNCIEVVSVVGMSILEDRPEVFKALLHAHLHRLKAQNPKRFLQLGLDKASPFNPCVKGIHRKHITEGKIFYVTTGRKPPVIPNFSRLEVARI